MKGLSTVFSILILQICIEGSGQFKYDKRDDIIPFSYVYPKIQKLKSKDKIATLFIPAYNVDSIFWEKNIKLMIREVTRTGYHDLAHRRISGFSLDTLVSYFEHATRIRIKEGFVWLFKITSPTAQELSVVFTMDSLKTNSYISAHSNYHDSLDGPYKHSGPDVHTLNNPLEKGTNNNLQKGKYAMGTYGNMIYLEIFSPTRDIEHSNFEIHNILYIYYTGYQLNEAPQWIRDRYPDIDFENRCRKVSGNNTPIK